MLAVSVLLPALVLLAGGLIAAHHERSVDLALDVFSTGMWIGHAVLWAAALGVGVLLGAVLGSRPDGTLAAR